MKRDRERKFARSNDDCDPLREELEKVKVKIGEARDKKEALSKSKEDLSDERDLLKKILEEKYEEEKKIKNNKKEIEVREQLEEDPDKKKKIERDRWKVQIKKREIEKDIFKLEDALKEKNKKLKRLSRKIREIEKKKIVDLIEEKRDLEKRVNLNSEMEDGKKEKKIEKQEDPDNEESEKSIMESKLKEAKENLQKENYQEAQKIADKALNEFGFFDRLFGFSEKSREFKKIIKKIKEKEENLFDSLNGDIYEIKGLINEKKLKRAKKKLEDFDKKLNQEEYFINQLKERHNLEKVFNKLDQRLKKQKKDFLSSIKEDLNKEIEIDSKEKLKNIEKKIKKYRDWGVDEDEIKNLQEKFKNLEKSLQEKKRREEKKEKINERLTKIKELVNSKPEEALNRINQLKNDLEGDQNFSEKIKEEISFEERIEKLKVESEKIKSLKEERKRLKAELGKLIEKEDLEDDHLKNISDKIKQAADKGVDKGLIKKARKRKEDLEDAKKRAEKLLSQAEKDLTSRNYDKAKENLEEIKEIDFIDSYKEKGERMEESIEEKKEEIRKKEERLKKIIEESDSSKDLEKLSQEIEKAKEEELSPELIKKARKRKEKLESDRGMERFWEKEKKDKEYGFWGAVMETFRGLRMETVRTVNAIRRSRLGSKIIPGSKYLLVGVDISDHSIEVLFLDRSRTVTSQGRAILNEGVVENGEIIDQKKLSEKLKETLKRTKPIPLDIPEHARKRGFLELLERKHKVIVSLPDSKTYIQTFSFDNQINIHKKVEDSVRKSFPIEQEDLYWDYVKISTKKGVKVLCVAALRDFVDMYTYFFRSANIEPVIFEIEGVAVGRALLPEDKESHTVMIIDMGAKSSTLNIFNRSGDLTLSTSLPFAGNYFTKKIADNLGLSYGEAEELKRKKGFKKSENVFPILEEHGRKLTEEIKRSSSYHEGEFGERVEKIILIGGTSLLPGLDQFLSENLNDFEVEKGNPLKKIKSKDIFDHSNSLFYSNVVGLSLRSLKKNPTKGGINLLPKEVKDQAKQREKETERRLIIVALVIIGFLTILFLGYFLYSNKFEVDFVGRDSGGFTAGQVEDGIFLQEGQEIYSSPEAERAVGFVSEAGEYEVLERRDDWMMIDIYGSSGWVSGGESERDQDSVFLQEGQEIYSSPETERVVGSIPEAGEYEVLEIRGDRGVVRADGVTGWVRIEDIEDEEIMEEDL